jgi:hypothetical protein
LSNKAHVSESLDVRPAGGEDALAEGIILDLGNDSESGAFKSKIETHRRPRRG